MVSKGRDCRAAAIQVVITADGMRMQSKLGLDLVDQGVETASKILNRSAAYLALWTVKRTVRQGAPTQVHVQAGGQRFSRTAFRACTGTPLQKRPVTSNTLSPALTTDLPQHHDQ